MMLLFLIGLAIGSFINVVVIRLYKGETLLGRSRCLHCHSNLRWYHNIPVFSFLVLKGKCFFCGQPIGWQYPVVEIITATLFLAVGFMVTGQSVGYLLASLVLTFYVVVLAVFDWRHQVLPDVLTLSGAVVMLVINLWRGQSSWLNLLAGAALAAGFFALQYYISKGAWIGAGDIRLGIWLGFSLGLKAAAVALILAYWSGALIGLILLSQKKWHRKSRIPFGIFLALSTWVAWFWGNNLASWYFGYLGF